MPLDEDDQAVELHTLSRLGREVRALDDVLISLNHGAVELTGATHDRGVQLAAILLLARAWNSLWRARVDVTTGYYIQGFAMCRTAFEDWLVMEYLDARPADAPLWLKGITVQADEYNTMTFAKIIPVVAERIPAAGAMYGDLCSMSHPTGASLRWSLDADADTWSLRAGPKFDEADARSALTYLLTIALQLYTPIERLHLAMLGSFHSEWREASRPVIAEACRILGTKTPWDRE
jgi:uncharacterized protein YbdZ (MbtH family)